MTHSQTLLCFVLSCVACCKGTVDLKCQSSLEEGEICASVATVLLQTDHEVRRGVVKLASSKKEGKDILADAKEETPSLRKPQPDALLEADDAQTKQTKASQPKPPTWFGGFAAGESTYDHDGLFEGRKENPQIDA